MKTFKTACPLDCWDQCALVAEVDQGALISLKADPGQPVTGGFICAKGKKHLERASHPDRLLYPQLKINGVFKRISWSDAVDATADRIEKVIKKFGPLALLHFYDGGYGGLLKNIEARFFSALGGSTRHQGSLCWGAGIAAQRYDFGAAQSHAHADFPHSKLILIWGRNPAYTQVHLLPYLKEARRAGAQVVVIDPVNTATVNLANRYVRVKPASDGALALGMAKIIIERGLYDRQFVENHSTGFEQFKALCAEYDLKRVSRITDLAEAEIEDLAVTYAQAKPAAILLGIGLQRHSNGGNTIRAIDALAALCGNIGVPGGGASYANFRVTRYIDHDFLSGVDLKPRFRHYPKPQLAATLQNLTDPPIAFLYISRSNPLTQVGDSTYLRQAMAKVPFIVTAEHFMTDTAAASDLVLPATNFLEAEDLYFNSMSHHYLVYGEKALEAPGECRPEYEFFAEIAGRLGLEGYPTDPQVDNLLERAIKPLTDATGITLRKIRAEGPLEMPGGGDIPWQDRHFETADGRYNFFSAQAERDGVGGLPAYLEPVELSDQKMIADGYRYWFLTPHRRESIHATHMLPDVGLEPKAYVHPQTAEEERLAGGEPVVVSSIRGQIQLNLEVSDRVPPGAVMVYQGWWEGSGAAGHKLTPDRLTDFGNQAAYYDCLCRIEKLK